MVLSLFSLGLFGFGWELQPRKEEHVHEWCRCTPAPGDQDHRRDAACVGGARCRLIVARKVSLPHGFDSRFARPALIVLVNRNARPVDLNSAHSRRVYFHLRLWLCTVMLFGALDTCPALVKDPVANGGKGTNVLVAP